MEIKELSLSYIEKLADKGKETSEIDSVVGGHGYGHSYGYGYGYSYAYNYYYDYYVSQYFPTEVEEEPTVEYAPYIYIPSAATPATR